MGLKLFDSFGYKKKPSIFVNDAVPEDKVKARIPAVKVTKLSVGSVARRSPGKHSPMKNVLRPVPSGSLSISESQPMSRAASKSAPEYSTPLKDQPAARKLFNEMEIKAASAISASPRPVSSPARQVKFGAVETTLFSLPAAETAEQKLASVPKTVASKAAWPSTGSTVSSPKRAVPVSTAGLNPGDEKFFLPGDEKFLLSGFITTDRPKDLSRRALGELASGDDDKKLLCAGPVNGLTGFGPREASDGVENEAKACAAYLLWHPVAGRHLVDQVQGGVVTVGDLKLALEKIREDF